MASWREHLHLVFPTFVLVLQLDFDHIAGNAPFGHVEYPVQRQDLAAPQQLARGEVIAVLAAAGNRAATAIRTNGRKTLRERREVFMGPACDGGADINLTAGPAGMSARPV